MSAESRPRSDEQPTEAPAHTPGADRPADRLREAAQRLRALATAAVDANGDDPWTTGEIGWSRDRECMTHDVKAGDVLVTDPDLEETAAYIAAMHPGVALALEDLLEHLAADRDNAEVDGRTLDAALRVADLILTGAGR